MKFLIAKMRVIFFLNILALSYLCEFIEDCEHDSLAIEVLHLLGEQKYDTEEP